MSQRILIPRFKTIYEKFSVFFALHHAHGWTHEQILIGPQQGFEDTSKGRLHKNK
jgi:hypothetical protein